MRAMVYRSPYRVRVEEKAPPTIEHPNDAIVKVDLAAICGSDLHLYHGLMPDTRVGHTFGHEFVGTVDQVGPSVSATGLSSDLNTLSPPSTVPRHRSG